MNFVRRALPKRRLTGEGIAPHAPYTTSSDLLDRVRSLTRQRPMPITVHWSETESEIDWLSRGAGELAHVLGASPRCGGLDLLDRAGLLGKHTSLAHGNHPRRGEPERIAAKGATLVHCPGTHAFFGRAAFPWRRYARAGVRIALGTDSLASNSNLDMRREMALVRAGNLSLSAREVFSMATEGGARALGLGGRVGVLARGAEADLVLHRLPADLASEPLEALTSGEGSVGAVWLAGRRVFGKR